MIKRVGYNFYVHKSNIFELYSKLDIEDRNILINVLKGSNYIYDVIKYDKRTKNVSLIECKTWDILNEPIVGDSHCYRIDGTISLVKGGTKVYHNKWQFVSNDYVGFSLEESKRRTKEWNKINGIKLLKSKIGNKDFWYKLLYDNGLEI